MPDPAKTLYREYHGTLDPVAESGERADVWEFSASLSSEALVPRWFGLEELVHTPAAVDLSADTGRGYPLLSNHDRDTLIGRVTDVRVADGRLRGRVRLSQANPAARIWRDDLLSGIAGDVSAGYDLDGARMDTIPNTDPPVVRVSGWRPREFSLVSVPADPSVGIGRSNPTEDPVMPENTENTERAALEAGIAAERKRVADIRAKFAPFEAPEVRACEALSIESGDTVDQASARLLATLGSDLAPLGDDVDQGARGGFTSRADRVDIRAGADKRDQLERGARQALEFRAGLMPASERETYRPGENPFQSFTLSELARSYAHEMFPGESWGSRTAMVGDLFARSSVTSHGTGDFGNLLVSIGSKALIGAYMEADETWRAWVKIGNLQNFLQAARVGVSEFPTPPVVPENADFPYADISDVRENIQLAKYGQRVSFSRELIINDDLAGLMGTPTKLGRAAARVPGDLAYGVLTANAALNQDSTDLFHADHGNLVASGGAAPSVITVSAARVAMAQQTDYSGHATLGIRLGLILVPLELEDATRVLAAAEYDPAGTAGTLTPNTQRGRFEVVADHRLSTASAAEWYAAARPGSADTVEVAFLDGNSEPQTERETQFSNDSVAWKVRLECAAAALDFRGLYKNVGA